jgi:hypothetical protein
MARPRKTGVSLEMPSTVGSARHGMHNPVVSATVCLHASDEIPTDEEGIDIAV